MKDKQAGQNTPNLPVVCTWCGVIIRHSDTKASHGMCLKCFARMMNEHNRPYQQGQQQRYAIER